MASLDEGDVIHASQPLGVLRGKILVGHQSRAIARDLQTQLETEGYQVNLAADGVDVVRRAHLDLPDLILLDPTVRKMNGRQVCRLLKYDEHTRHVPVLLLVSEGQPVEEYWNLPGADAYVAREHVLEHLGNILPGLGRGQPLLPEPHRTAQQAPSEIDVLATVNTLLDKKLYEATILNQINNLAQSMADYEETIRSVLDLLGKLVEYQVACFLVSGERNSHLIVKPRVALQPEQVSMIARRLVQSFSIQVGRPVDIENVVVRTDRSGEWVDCVQVDDEYIAHPSILLPVGMKGRMGGLLALWSGKHRRLAEEELITLGMVASAAYLVVDNARLYDEIRQMAITDDLTGLYNRRYLDEQVEKEFQRAQRSGLSFSVLWIDLDHFKAINDSHGHLYGDRILRSLAQLLRVHTRPYDIVARVGGEEFAVVLPETTRDQAFETGERLRELVLSQHSASGQPELTISVGVATHPHPDIVHATDLYRLADEALYRAKRAGRNRVCL